MKTEKNILIAFILNLSFSIFEFFGGLFTNSIAIISDAIHDIGDAISIGISYILEKKSKRKPDQEYTYGYVRYSNLGALITNTILLVGSILVIINALKRIINPVQVNYNGMIIFAIFGVITNILAAHFTKKGESLNQKAVNLHMLEDALGWIIVLIGSIIIKYTSITIIDPIMSILVSIFILINVVKNLKIIIDLFLEKTPNNISIDTLKKHLLEITNIKDVHHIHIWSLDGITNYATIHIVVEKNNINTKEKAKKKLKQLGINHVTIETETLNEKCDEPECHIENHSNNHHHHHH